MGEGVLHELFMTPLLPVKVTCSRDLNIHAGIIPMNSIWEEVRSSAEEGMGFKHVEHGQACNLCLCVVPSPRPRSQDEVYYKKFVQGKTV